MDIVFTGAILVLTGFGIHLWRQNMTLQESLDKTVQDLADARAYWQQKVAEIPALVTAALDKAIADYIAAHPASLDGVTQASLTAAMQSITDDTKNILANSDAIAVNVADAVPTP